MKVKARKTLKNAYDQVLFMAGREYEAEEDGKRYFILNEIHSETLVRKSALDRDFEIC